MGLLMFAKCCLLQIRIVDSCRWLLLTVGKYCFVAANCCLRLLIVVSCCQLMLVVAYCCSSVLSVVYDCELFHVFFVLLIIVACC